MFKINAKNTALKATAVFVLFDHKTIDEAMKFFKDKFAGWEITSLKIGKEKEEVKKSDKKS